MGPGELCPAIQVLGEMIPIGQVLVPAARFFVPFEIVQPDDVHAHAVHYRHHAPRVYLAEHDLGYAGLDLGVP